MESLLDNWLKNNCITVDKIHYLRESRQNFSCKSTIAANVDLMESLLDNWLKNNQITVDKIYFLRSLFVYFLRILVFKVISQPQKTGTKTESCGNSLKLDLSE